MIELHVNGNGYELNDKIKDYVKKKIGRLDRYLSKDNRQAAGTVTLTLDKSGREDNQCVCEVILTAPGFTAQAKEATLNMYAAIDIAEAKLKAQMSKQKDKNSPKSRRRLFSRILGRQT